MKIANKSNSNIEQGYVHAPYIPLQTSEVVVEYGSKIFKRKRKINNIFNLGLDIKDEFSPRKNILSRYSKKIVSNKYYKTIEIKNPLYEWVFLLFIIS